MEAVRQDLGVSARSQAAFGIVAMCNACRVKSGPPTLLVTVPEELREPGGG
jgi:hypothetical protein